MAITPFDSAIWRELYGDAEIAALFTESAEVRAMLLFEGALARVQGRLGLIPEVSAAAISRAAETVMIEAADKVRLEFDKAAVLRRLSS